MMDSAEKPENEVVKLKKTEVFAHRGASGYAPENTLAAFRLAMQQRGDGIELDVQLSRDGVPVVIHDETVDRVTDRKGFVRDYTREELQTMQVLPERYPDCADAYIPTLQEVLELVRPSGMRVNIELKTGIFWYPEIEKKTAAVVAETGMQARVIYSSFNHYSVQRLMSWVPEAETAYLFSDVILDVDRYAQKSGVEGLHPALYHTEMGDFLRQYLAGGLRVRVWTVNEPEDMERLIRAGVTAIITNFPDRAIAVRKALQEETHA